MAKRARTETTGEDKLDALKQAIAMVNTLIGKRDMFVCWGCGKLVLGSGEALATSKWGYERLFCDACPRECPECDETYAPSMAYRHEDCCPASCASNDGKEKEEEEDAESKDAA